MDPSLLLFHSNIAAHDENFSAPKDSQRYVVLQDVLDDYFISLRPTATAFLVAPM